MKYEPKKVSEECAVKTAIASLSLSSPINGRLYYFHVDFVLCNNDYYVSRIGSEISPHVLPETTDIFRLLSIARNVSNTFLRCQINLLYYFKTILNDSIDDWTVRRT